LRRSAAENQEGRWPARTIGENTQDREKLRPALDLIEDHQPSERFESEHRLRQPGERAGILEIEEGRATTDLVGEHPGQRALADLPGAEQRNDGKLPRESP